MPTTPSPLTAPRSSQTKNPGLSPIALCCSGTITGHLKNGSLEQVMLDGHCPQQDEQGALHRRPVPEALWHPHRVDLGPEERLGGRDQPQEPRGLGAVRRGPELHGRGSRDLGLGEHGHEPQAHLPHRGQEPPGWAHPCPQALPAVLLRWAAQPYTPPFPLYLPLALILHPSPCCPASANHPPLPLAAAAIPRLPWRCAATSSTGRRP